MNVDEFDKNPIYGECLIMYSGNLQITYYNSKNIFWLNPIKEIHFVKTKIEGVIPIPHISTTGEQ